MADPCLFIIIGVTGDLTKRKLLPALFHLRAKDLLHDDTVVLGVARGMHMNDASLREYTHQVFEEMSRDLKARGELTDQMLSDARIWCDKAFHYQPLDQSTPSDYTKLAERIAQVESENNLPGDRVFYLAIPPNAVEITIRGFGEAGLNRSSGWTRVVVEKPFGHDLTTAQHLNDVLHQYYDEHQIYRIDHYLGKETVQNLIAFRFGNMLFESLWNRDRIDNVQITAAEDIGIENRGAYYDKAGALRDMVQNHLTQLLTLTAMEVPASFEADAIRYEKIKVLQSIARIDPKDVVYGQYAASEVHGIAIPAYQAEANVDPESNTETFAALKLHVNNWRWQGVPFYLRTGKRLERHTTEIVVTFRSAPVTLFQEMVDCHLHPNILVIKIQPNEGFDLTFEVKIPGDGLRLQTHHMHFDYAEAFGALPDGYQTLLLDLVAGDQTLFIHADETEASWKLYTPLFSHDIPVYDYPAGSWGPQQSSDLLQQHHATWTLI